MKKSTNTLDNTSLKASLELLCFYRGGRVAMLKEKFVIQPQGKRMFELLWLFIWGFYMQVFIYGFYIWFFMLENGLFSRWVGLSAGM